MVFQKLFEKLEQERESLGGKVFDILGKMTFDNKSLKDLLIEAIRYGDDPAVKARLTQVVDNSMDKNKLRQLLDERALTEDTMDVHKIQAIREDMERKEAHKLQPHFIEAFFIEAFKTLGGKIRPREKGRYEISSVPFVIRNRDMQIGFGEPVLNRYERVCFDKDYCNIAGQTQAALLSPGHPLLEAVIDLVNERNIDVMKRGSIFIDDSDFSQDARLLFYIEDAVQDGVILPNGGKRIISKHIYFVELKENDETVNAGYAPYLDYRAPEASEISLIQNWIHSQEWLTNGVEDHAKGYAIANLIPEHFAEVKARKTKMIDKTKKAVKERMTAEIQYWDFRAAELKQQESKGKRNDRLNSQRAERRAEELQMRMQQRLAELDRERMISATPPVVTGGALVIPKGLLHSLSGATNASHDLFGHGDRQTIEYAAMNAVMTIEKTLGYSPADVSGVKCGYDIESIIPQRLLEYERRLRFIEVKGRAKGSTTVTVSKNEILTALNKQQDYILAIVEVDGTETHTIYLKQPFKNSPDFTATSVNYDIQDLINNAEILYQK